MRGQSSSARDELARRNIKFTKTAFIENVVKGDKEAVKLFLDAEADFQSDCLDRHISARDTGSDLGGHCHHRHTCSVAATVSLSDAFVMHEFASTNNLQERLR